MLHKLTAAATAGIEKTRVKCADLKIGMYVAELDRSWIDSPFLVHGFTIRNDQQLQQLRATCQHVYVDIKRGGSQSSQLAVTKPKRTTSYNTTCSFEQNLREAITVHSDAKQRVESMFKAFQTNTQFDVEQARQTINRCVDNIIANPDSMLWLSMIKNKDEYTAEHSLNVALLSITLGRAEGLETATLQHLGLCAMLHDVGKVKIPDDILKKEGHLSDAEFATMKMHTVHGKKLLLGQSAAPDEAADIALLHHEKMDGSGYPRGLDGSKIPYLVKIVAIADAYDAMTSGRIYSEAKSAAETLKLLLKSKDTHHDGQLLNRFIDCIGVYPIGSVAELNSGEVGIVLPSDNNNKLQPAILLLRDSNKQPCLQRRIDLGTDKRADNARPYLIRALHPDGSFGIQLANYRQAHLQ
jgi:HD-GYP domain-containing protein (c-di-GMP phosphodiesterase class II)